MSEPLNNENFFDEARKNIEEYAKVRYDLARLEVAEKSAKVTGSLFSAIVLGAVLFFVILFASLVAGFYFSEVFGSIFKGFSLIAGIYMMLFFILLLFRKSLLELPVINKVIAVIYGDQE